ncbi:S41 family peptidase [Anaeromyxobacter paludicola]|uniref:Carboxyl-terminal processing protease n=1 Tax=Anaeromyxobacter paludicola TaxID=2918171 RepID=A0ABM7XE22_9BACT|nr:S41 family peptidase [Anaeromyxobacter paludicola]BDG10140.1 carboxyl-terminal processing protease [Anaeromyxobacter paludicola]
MLAVCLVLALAAAPGPAPGGAAPVDPTLSAVDRIVRRDFYAPELLVARGWDRLVDAARRRLAATPAERERILRELLEGLGASHTEYVPRSDVRYWELASVLAPVFPEVPDHCPDPAALPPFPLLRDEIGAVWLRVEGRWHLGGVFEGGPARRAGLLEGDELVSADGAPFDPISAFAGKSGRSVALEYRRRRGGPLAVARVVPGRRDPQAAFREALRDSARILERGGRRIAYVHVWSWAGDEMQEELRAAIARLNDRAPDAFVLDLRDGWGGAAPGYLGILDRRVPVLESVDRAGVRRRWDPQVRVPAALLVNGGTRSGKEVIAHAVKKHGLAVLVGERTAGAVLPGSPYCLPDGALLFLAVARLRVDGESLEGKGVEPDLVVPRSLPYAAGADPQLERALEHLAAGGAHPGAR